MAIRLKNYHSGELLISDDEGHTIRLDPGAANRLVMYARMHSVSDFSEEIHKLIQDPALSQAILNRFNEASSSTERWNLKEKIARLVTMVKGYEPKEPEAVLEEISL